MRKRNNTKYVRRSVSLPEEVDAMAMEMMRENYADYSNVINQSIQMYFKYHKNKK